MIAPDDEFDLTIEEDDPGLLVPEDFAYDDVHPPAQQSGGKPSC